MSTRAGGDPISGQAGQSPVERRSAMTTNPNPLSRWWSRAGAAILLLAGAGCTPSPAQTVLPVSPIPPQQARIWFYRDLDPNHTQARPYLRLNGAIAAISEPGGSFYRDVAPGHYHITVDSYGVDFDQERDVDLLPGQEVFTKVVSNDNWVDFGGGGDMGGGSFHRDTFYVWAIPPQRAVREMGFTRFFGGGTLTAALPPR